MPSRFITIPRAGALALLKSLWKHKYLIIVIIALLPSIFSAISYAKETKNPSYPFVALGLHLINADSMIGEKVDKLRENPSELIGMVKPTVGVWAKVKYYFSIFKVVWLFLGNIFLISVPFVVFYKYFKWKGSKGFKSSVSHNLSSALLWGFVFVFIVNLIIVTHGVIRGNSLLVIPEDLDFYGETLFIIKNTLPFRGVVKLVMYLFSAV